MRVEQATHSGIKDKLPAAKINRLKKLIPESVRLSGKDVLAALAIPLLMVLGGCMNNEGPIPVSTPRSAVMPTLEPTATVVVYSQEQVKESLIKDPASIERLRYEKEIEKKYGIELLTMQQAYKFLGKEYNELDLDSVPLNLPVRWSSEQLKMYDDFLSYMPPTSYEPINGKNFKLFLKSGPDSCLCAGQYHGNGVISVSESTYRPQAFSTLIHEATHRLDLENKLFLQKGVRGIIGDRLRELHTAEDLILRNAMQNSLELDIILSLADTGISGGYSKGEGPSSPDNHKHIIEGVAGLSQMYIKGYEQFMSKLGPILDGNGRTYVKEIDPSKDLAENFPKTQSLYDFYKKNVFGGMEFDKDKIRLIAGEEDEISLIGGMEQDYGIKIEVAKILKIYHTLSPGGYGEMKLGRMLEAFPKDFYSARDGEKLTIGIKDGAKNEFSSSKYGDRIDIYYENIYVDESKTVIVGRSSKTTLSMSDSLAYGLVKRADEATGYKTRDNIIGILGGEAFLNAPEALYPELKKFRGSGDPYTEAIDSIFYSGNQKVRDSSEMVGRLGVLYMRGWKEFSESLGPTLDSQVDLTKDSLGTKTLGIYSEMQALYSGVEFNGNWVEGVPVRRSTPSLDN